VVVPALDEEANIADAVREILASLGDRFSDHELLLFNDGSRDGTGRLMDELAAKNPKIRVTHNASSRNLGGVYKQGIAMARHEYLLMIPGDNENPRSALAAPFDAIGKADLIVPYPTNPQARSAARTFISRSYVALLNAMFGLRLRYYNGTVIHRTELLRTIDIETDSFAYQSEILVKLLRAGSSYLEVGIEIDPKPGRRSKAFRLKNMTAVGRTLLALALESRGRAGGAS
jgi:glycosyltransferase involved in cell wall biosynthesis